MKPRSSMPVSALIAVASCCAASLVLAQDNQNMPPPETRSGPPIDQPAPAPDPTSAGASTMPSDTMPSDSDDSSDASGSMDSDSQMGSDPDAMTPDEDATGTDATGTDSDNAASPAGSAPDATTSANLDQSKIEKFADAYVAVQSIQQKAAADLQKTSDPAQADKVKSSAQTDMIAAVERSGLQVEEFNQIVQSMAADNNIRTRVAAEVQKRTPPASSTSPSTDPTNSGGG
ncbi:MAG TPA: DUF4168 domain-containing protein [Steroidobacteraceae bacterium]|nr:DUF4168 domain-containing protein [Steroidobacteraceae bacterium]